MKSKMIYAIIVTIILAAGSIAYAENCDSNTIVRRWITERDDVSLKLLQSWCKGQNPRESASDVALMLSNELYICGKCRNDPDFLKNNLILLNTGAQPKVETIPVILLERMLGYPILSPHRDFPNALGGGAK